MMMFKVIQGHQVSYQWKVHMQVTICELISYLALFQIYAGLLVQFHCWQWMSLLCTCSWWIPNSGLIAKFCLKKQETPIYQMVWSVLCYRELFRHDSFVWQTDRQTDGRTDRLSHSKCHASLCCNAKKEKIVKVKQRSLRQFGGTLLTWKKSILSVSCYWTNTKQCVTMWYTDCWNIQTTEQRNKKQTQISEHLSSDNMRILKRNGKKLTQNRQRLFTRQRTEIWEH